MGPNQPIVAMRLSGLTEATGNGRTSDWDRFQNNPNQRLMRRGQRGPDIAALQGRLTELGYMTEAQRRTGPGIFGSLTERAVTRFQRDHGLDRGRCGRPADSCEFRGEASRTGSSASRGTSECREY